MSDNATTKSDATQLDTGKHTPKKRASKIETALTLLFLSRDKGITQPDAHKAYAESCLHTTISSIQMTHGIQVDRRPSSTTNHYGGKPFNKYWIPQGKNRDLAQAVLLKMATKRGAEIVSVKPIIS